MKYWLSISFIITSTAVFSQESPAALADQLTARHTTELAKVNAIFHWITANISYRVKPDNKTTGRQISKNKKLEIEWDDEDDDLPLKPLNERVAETVLKKRESVCDGYARLFTTLCDFAGIRSEIIPGFANSGTSRSVNRFGVNHYWNAVMIDSNWYLLDATWASGYISLGSNQFVKMYDAKYYLTPPEIFIKDHYPDDARWTLLPDSKFPNDFYRSPFRQKSFFKYNIAAVFPASGIIDTYVGDTLRMVLKTPVTEKDRTIVPDLLIDSAIFTHSPAWIFLRPDNQDLNAITYQHNYIYPVVSTDIQWLYLMYNEDLVLRYKINVKNKKAD